MARVSTRRGTSGRRAASSPVGTDMQPVYNLARGGAHEESSRRLDRDRRGRVRGLPEKAGGPDGGMDREVEEPRRRGQRDGGARADQHRRTRGASAGRAAQGPRGEGAPGGGVDPL